MPSYSESLPSMSLISQNFHQCPITAIALTASHPTVVLVGEGSSLKIYDLSKNALLGVLNHCLGYQPIHGISLDNVALQRTPIGQTPPVSYKLRCILWGGTSARFLNIHLPADHGSWSPVHSLTERSQNVYQALCPSQGQSTSRANSICWKLDEETASINDWILDLSFVPTATEEPINEGLLAIGLTARNWLHLIRSDFDGLIQTSAISCGDQTTLFCGQLHWSTPNEILAVVGTVSGHIEIWKRGLIFDKWGNVVLKGGTSSSIRAHQGSIFGISMSVSRPKQGLLPKITLASCSDDRHVRAWDLGGVEYFANASQNHDPADPETGFLQSFNEKSSYSAVHSESSHSVKDTLATVQANATISQEDLAPTGEYPPRTISAIGHQSRVWRVVILGVSENSVFLLSAGEDCTIHLWEGKCLLKGSTTSCKELSLRAIQSFKHHTGRNIWAVAQNSMLNLPLQLATGGADGALAIQELPTLEPVESRAAMKPLTGRTRFEVFNNHIMDTILLDGVTQGGIGASIDPQKDFKENATFVSYKLLGNDRIVATSRFGHVFFGRIVGVKSSNELISKDGPSTDRQSQVNWDGCIKEPGLAGWNTVALVPNYGAIFGNRNSSLFVWRALDNHWAYLRTFDRCLEKIFAISAYNNNEGVQAALITSWNATTATFLVWQHGNELDQLKSWEWPLRLPKNTIITAVAYLRHVDRVVVGTRLGWLIFFKLPSFREPPIVQNSTESFGTLHMKNAITCILDLGQSPERHQVILTAGRDGTAKVFAFQQGSEGKNNPVLRRLHGVKLPFTDQVEGAFVRCRELIVWGFNGKDFILWNYSRNMKILEVNCGGGNRSWSFSLNRPGTTGGCFAWTQNSRSYIYRQIDASYFLLQPGLHGREINCVAVNPNRAEVCLIATGSEDTTIRISVPAQADGSISQLRTACTISNHLTGVSQLHWSSDGRYLFSSGGAEQLLAWRICTVPILEVGASLVGQCPHITSTQQLRIMDFAVVPDEMLSLDGDSGIESFYLPTAYSDASLRVWHARCLPWQESENDFDLAAEGNYGHNCLTRIKHFSISNEHYFITSATDGQLAIWHFSRKWARGDPPMSLEVLTTLAVHQSSIKSLDLHFHDECDGILLAATGGDDNAIALIAIGTFMELGVTSFWFLPAIVPKAHAASVTAVKLVEVAGLSRDLQAHVTSAKERVRSESGSSEAPSMIFLLSASNDQFVRVWGIDLSGQRSAGASSHVEIEVDVTRHGKLRSEVADISSIDLMREGGWKAVIAGVGVEIWDINGT